MCHIEIDSCLPSDLGVLEDGALIVHALVVGLVIAADDAHPPVAVLEVPFDRLLDAVLKFRLRFPAELRVDLRRVDGVAAVVALAVGDVLDEVFGLAELLEDGLDNVDVGALIVAADVVDLADAALLQDQVDGMAVILDVEPVADVLAVTVDRQLLVGQRVDDHQRDELLREVVRAVVVRAARDRRRDLVGAMVSHDKQVRTGLRSRIRARRLEVRLLREEQVRAVERQVAVDLIRRDLMVAIDAILAAGVEQDARADDVRLQEDLRILDGAVDMRLCREVDDDVRLLLLKDAVDRLAVRDVRADELEVLLLHRRLERLKIARIRQLVDADDAVSRMLLEHVVDKVRTDEAGTAGHNNIHIAIPPMSKQHKKPSAPFSFYVVLYTTQKAFSLLLFIASCYHINLNNMTNSHYWRVVPPPCCISSPVICQSVPRENLLHHHHYIHHFGTLPTSIYFLLPM